jgi:hypothetical protein
MYFMCMYVYVHVHTTNRRVLRKIAEGQSSSLGDVSTLADPAVVDILIVKVDAIMAQRNAIAAASAALIAVRK